MQDLIISYVYRIIPALAVLLFALPLHECAHGYVAYLLGDDTAKRQGRLTLNPIRHLDPIGAICILFLGFGWAKPVPVNPYNFKNRKIDMAVTSIAGPLTNLLLAFLSLLILAGGMKIAPATFYNSNLILYFFVTFAEINIMLCIFNLIPIPPLDGSRLLALFLPENALASFERFGAIPVLIIVFIFWRYISAPIMDLTYYILNAFSQFLNLPFRF
jgi:Zn-dependent protease